MVEAPTPWRIWHNQFRLALFAKTNVNLKVLLKHCCSADVLPLALQEAPASSETAAQRTTREAASRTERSRYDTACEDALQVACCGVTRKKADLKATSYMSLYYER